MTHVTIFTSFTSQIYAKNHDNIFKIFISFILNFATFGLAEERVKFLKRFEISYLAYIAISFAK